MREAGRMSQTPRSSFRVGLELEGGTPLSGDHYLHGLGRALPERDAWLPISELSTGLNHFLTPQIEPPTFRY